MNYETIKLFIKWESQEGGVNSLQIQLFLVFKMLNYLSINSNDVKFISVKVFVKNRKNTVFNVLYREPNGQT